jgi:uncharacterized membrane protein YccC
VASTAAPSLRWSWDDALRSALCGLPAVPIAVLSDPGKGMAWAVGCLPVAALGLAPTRRARRRVVVVGVLFALSVFTGSLLAQSGFTTVVGIFGVAFGSALLASRSRFGLVALTLCLPVCAIGLSFGDLAEAAILGGVFIAAAAFSYAVLRRWPEYQPRRAPAQPQLLSRRFARQYAVLLGLAGATSALVGLLIHTDHVGWAPAAGYFVMRPAPEMQKLRSAGRILSVFVGALAGVVFVHWAPPDLVIGLVAVALIAATGATHESRWYVTPAFGSALVLTMLLYQHPTVATEAWRFNERVGETVLGVASAYFWGVVVPSRLRNRRRSASSLTGP